MIQQLIAVDDFISYQAGTHIVKLTWTNHGVYTVTVSNGVAILDDLGGPFPTETEARLIARGYAQMFNAEHNAKTATLDAYARPGRRDFTRSRVHRQDPTPAELHAIRQAVDNGDGTFTVRTRPGQTWLVLRGLYRRIGGERKVRKGTRSVIASLTYTAEQLAPYLPIAA